MSGHAASDADDRYRRERPPCSADLSTELSRITSDIDDPVVKLRYLRTAVETSADDVMRRAPFSPVRRAWFRLRGLAALDAVTDAGRSALVAARTLTARRKAQRTLGAAAAIAFIVVPAGIAVLASQFSTPPPLQASAAPLSPAPLAKAAPELTPAAPPIELAPVAEAIPQDPLGISPSTIWLADRGADWELYSNGLRIETGQTVLGAPRRYRVHHRTEGLQAAVHHKPVGILFHTSESDLWPLEEAFDKDLRRSSSGLVRYVRGQQSYNYLIDRFGRVYRVVDDESKANHAGHGVWARADEVFLDLNNAFLGVAFESRWDGGRTLPITRAQLIAGRNLTHYLRQRFAIAPEMCVTHGLTSVAPRKRLIGYHRDWARGFPFEAFGLPDLYAQPTPSVALFGFGYDDHFLRTVGERWPGLVAAEGLLAEEAQARNVPLADLRRERQALYEKWSQDGPRLHGAAHTRTTGE